jgi:hypothetical protein
MHSLGFGYFFYIFLYLLHMERPLRDHLLDIYILNYVLVADCDEIYQLWKSTLHSLVFGYFLYAFLYTLHMKRPLP